MLWRLCRRMAPVDWLLLLGSVYFLAMTANLVVQELRLQRYAQLIETELHETQSEQMRLMDAIQHYRSPEGVEEIARQQLGYVKKGEIPVRFLKQRP